MKPLDIVISELCIGKSDVSSNLLLDTIALYNKDLTLDMFIPVSDEGNPIKDPSTLQILAGDKVGGELFCRLIANYDAAKRKTIFSNFEVFTNRDDYVVVGNDHVLLKYWYKTKTFDHYNKIKDLSKCKSINLTTND